jgi:hypothetical protein
VVISQHSLWTCGQSARLTLNPIDFDSIFPAFLTSQGTLAGYWPDLACRAYSIARNDLRQGFLPRGSPHWKKINELSVELSYLCRSIEHNNLALSDLSGISDRSVSPIWVNYNISLTWNKAIWGWFLLLTMIPVRSQWGRYNLPSMLFVQTIFLGFFGAFPGPFWDSHVAADQEGLLDPLQSLVLRRLLVQAMTTSQFRSKVGWKNWKRQATIYKISSIYFQIYLNNSQL